MGKEFDFANFAAEEKMMLDNCAAESTNNTTNKYRKVTTDPILIENSEPVTAAMEVETENQTVRCINLNILSTLSKSIACLCNT